MNNKDSKTISFYVVLWVAFYLLSTFIANYEDDLVFKAGIERYGSFAGWVDFFSHNWGGRVIPQGFLVILLQLPDIFFNAINSSAWVILLRYVCKVFDFSKTFDRKVEIILVLLLIFTIIPSAVLSTAVFWKCAAVLYLWGTACALIVLYPFVCAINNRSFRRTDIIFAILACVYNSSFEQGAVFMSGAIVVLLAYVSLKNKHADKTLVTLTFLSFALTIFFYMTPGNSARMEAEVLGQLPKFDMFSTTDKLLLGIKYTVENSETQVSVLFLILSLIVLASVYKTRQSDKLFKIAAWCVLIYFSLHWVSLLGTTLTGNGDRMLVKMFQCINVDTTSFTFSRKMAALECLHIGLITMLGVLSMFLVPKRVNMLIFISYFGGLATMAVMGFSPTIYASGLRPLFIGCLMLVCTVLCAGCDMIHNFGTLNKKETCAATFELTTLL